MKKNLLFLGLASVMLGFTGCAKDLDAENGTGSQPDAQGEPAPQTIVASMGDGMTRTALAPNGKSVVWKAGDKITVIGSNSAAATPGGDGDWNKTVSKIDYKLQAGADGQNMGTFDKIKTNNDSFLGLYLGGTLSGETTPLRRYIAVYPAENLGDIQRRTEIYTQFSIAVPIIQDYYPNTYDPKALPMIAAFDKGTAAEPVSKLQFKYVNSLLCVPVSAATEVTFDQITVSSVNSYGDLSNVAGSVGLDFNGDINVPNITAEELLANYTDMSKPFKVKLPIPAYESTCLTMFGTAKNPLTFGATESKIYFGILPGDYSESKFAIGFCFADGSKFEKICQGKVVESGKVITLPKSGVAKPYIPVMTYDAATKVVKWTTNDDVDSYQMDVWYNGRLYLSYAVPTGASSVDVAKEIYPLLAKKSIYELPYGGPHSMQLVMKAKLFDRIVASASYSAPTEIQYTRELVAFAPEVGIGLDDFGMSTENTANLKIIIKNYLDLSNCGATLSLEYVETKTTTYPFTNPSTAGVWGEMCLPYSEANWVRGTDYSFVCKATFTYMDADNVTHTEVRVSAPVLTTFADYAPQPKTIDATFDADYSGNKLIKVLNFKDILSCDPAAVVTVYGKQGINADMSNTSGLENKILTKDEAEGGLSLENFPAGRSNSTPCTYLIVATGARITTPLSVKISEGIAPTAVEFGEAMGGQIDIKNAGAIRVFAPNAVATVYVKKGVNQNMDNVEGLESKVISLDYPYIDLTSFPTKEPYMYYTYKVIVTDPSLPNGAISGVYSEPAPAKPTKVMLMNQYGVVYVENQNAFLYHYTDVVFTVYARDGVNANMDDVTGCETKVLAADERFFETASFPKDGNTKKCTYKVVAKGTGIEAAGVISE
ncbi:MAG: hypothetical protein RR996_04165 [Alistipes sp.]